jgi:hypothetical protein
MTKANRNRGKAWTKEDIAELRSLAKLKMPTRIIGLELGRTRAAIRTKASEYRISLGTRDSSPSSRRISQRPRTSV